MDKFSAIVKREYDREAKVLYETGNFWHSVLFSAIVLALGFGPALLSWNLSKFNKHDFGYALIVAICYPFAKQELERYRAAARMRHEREIRIEAKLDALLDLVGR